MSEELDRALIVVPLVRRLVNIGDLAEPYRILDGAGMAAQPAWTYFRDLQAMGRPVATVRSYGMDLLRWFRFFWDVRVRCDRATRVEARDFARWLQVSGKPVRVPRVCERHAAPRPRTPLI